MLLTTPTTPIDGSADMASIDRVKIVGSMTAAPVTSSGFCTVPYAGMIAASAPRVDGAAGDRHDADARPVQPAERGGGPGGDQHVLDRVDPDHAQVREDGVDDPGVADQRAGVRGRGAGG